MALRHSESARKVAIAELKKQQRALNRALAEVQDAREEYERLEATCDALEASIAELDR